MGNFPQQEFVDPNKPSISRSQSHNSLSTTEQSIDLPPNQEALPDVETRILKHKAQINKLKTAFSTLEQKLLKSKDQFTYNYKTKVDRIFNRDCSVVDKELCDWDLEMEG